MISVIIPTLNAENYIENLIEKLKHQKIDQEVEIIVIDSESSDKTVQIAKAVGATVFEIEKSQFDHGGTRNLAWDKSNGELICFITQDAVPADEDCLSNLVKGFADEEVVMISGRQLPKSDANQVERLTRSFNYPPVSNVRTKADISTMGIKAYFFSDVFAVYRRSFLETMGGFDSPILTNEDMLMAARALQAGYKVRYDADAAVYHSHNFTLNYQYRRNFDVAVFMEMYKDLVEGEGTTGEGIRMVLYTEKQLLLHFHLISAFRCVFESAAKFFGNRAGKKYKSMTREQILKKTTNPVFWKNNDISLY